MYFAIIASTTKKVLIVLSDFSSQKIRQRKLISAASVGSSDKRERARDKLAQQ
jgi:hypothetical protein